SEEHTSELQSLTNLVCRLLLEKKTKPATVFATRPASAPSQAPSTSMVIKCAALSAVPATGTARATHTLSSTTRHRQTVPTPSASRNARSLGQRAAARRPRLTTRGGLVVRGGPSQRPPFKVRSPARPTCVRRSSGRTASSFFFNASPAPTFRPFFPPRPSTD